LAAKLLTEFAVIVAGVLVALAADRWNQDRLDAQLEAVYLKRLIEDLTRDSLVAEWAVASVPGSMATRDSLLASVEGLHPLPADMVNAIDEAWNRPQLGEPPTWEELKASGRLSLLTDPETLSALSSYYAYRGRAITNMESAAIRGRSPFVDVIYQVGLVVIPAYPGAEEAFLAWPGMRQLLVGLGGYHSIVDYFSTGLISESGAALQRLRAQVEQ
jgi:hypothetical protein